VSIRISSIGMEADEVVRRVGLAYWPLIIALVIGGMAGAMALHFNDPPIYTSDVRFVLDSPDPHASAESTAIADTARSIATSPSHVAAALAVAGVNRDVNKFATRNVQLQALGVSGVMDLQVKDVSPVAAAAIANALAADLVTTRLAVSRSDANQLIAALTSQIKSLDRYIAKLDAETARYRSIRPDRLAGLFSVRTSAAQQRLTLLSQVDDINQALALRPHAAIIEAAQPATAPDSSRAPIDMGLAGLGGLVLGIILAALLAMWRPRISGRREISRILEAPVLGDFRTLAEGSDTSLPTRVRIAAMKAGVKHVQLVPLNGSAEAESLVDVLAQKLGTRPPAASSIPVPLHSNGEVVTTPKRRSRIQHQIDVTRFDPSVLSKNGNATETGLILVAPDVLNRKDLDASADLLSLTGCPVAGVVTYSRKSGRSRGAEKNRRTSVARPSMADHDVKLNPFGYL
jgi:capsular polysaccharide biosynthesis protein